MAVSATDEAKISTASKSARLRDIFWVFVKIGLLSFGGPAGQIALMHRILVDEKEWLDEQSFLNALNFCMLLPGPEAMQLATFAGWRLRGISGGLIAGGLFVLPGAVVMLILSIGYVAFSGTSMLSGIFLGVKAAILVVVVQALITLSRRALTHANARTKPSRMAPRVVYNDGKTRRLIHENGEQEDQLIEAVAGDIEPLASSSPLVAAFSRYAGELIEACEARKQEAVAESDAVLTHTELRKLCREVAKLSDGPGLHAAPVEPLLQLVGFARAHELSDVCVDRRSPLRKRWGNGSRSATLEQPCQHGAKSRTQG